MYGAASGKHMCSSSSKLEFASASIICMHFRAWRLLPLVLPAVSPHCCCFLYAAVVATDRRPKGLARPNQNGHLGRFEGVSCRHTLLEGISMTRLPATSNLSLLGFEDWFTGHIHPMSCALMDSHRVTLTLRSHFHRASQLTPPYSTAAATRVRTKKSICKTG